MDYLYRNLKYQLWIHMKGNNRIKWGLILQVLLWNLNRYRIKKKGGKVRVWIKFLIFLTGFSSHKNIKKILSLIYLLIKIPNISNILLCQICILITNSSNRGEVLHNLIGFLRVIRNFLILLNLWTLQVGIGGKNSINLSIIVRNKSITLITINSFRVCIILGRLRILIYSKHLSYNNNRLGLNNNKKDIKVVMVGVIMILYHWLILIFKIVINNNSNNSLINNRISSNNMAFFHNFLGSNKEIIYSLIVCWALLILLVYTVAIS